MLATKRSAGVALRGESEESSKTGGVSGQTKMTHYCLPVFNQFSFITAKQNCCDIPDDGTSKLKKTKTHQRAIYLLSHH